MNYSSLLAIIASNIYENHRGEVTANKVKAACDSIVNSLGYGYQFRGAAAPGDAGPGSIDQRVFYIASTPGTYSGFGGLTLAANEVALLKWDTEWHKETLDIPSKTQIMARLAAQDAQIAVQDGRLDGQDEEIADFEEAVQNQVDNYPMITINGNVTNAPDEEDITTDENDLLKFKNRSAVDGMGYVILRKGGSNTFANQVTEANTIYEIRYDFDLGGASVTIPAGCVLEFEGGSLSNGNIILSNNCRIEGNGATLYKVRILGTNNSGITILGLKLDSRLNGVNDLTFKSFIYFNGCTNVVLHDIDIVYFNHQWLTGETPIDVSPIYMDGCTNVYFYNLSNSGEMGPDGPYFDRCNKLFIYNWFISDEGKTLYISTNLNVFFSTDVIVRNCYFYHKTVSGGSTINFTVNRGIIENCELISGFGLDIGNETGEDFAGSYIIVRNCQFKNTRFVCYGSGNDKFTLNELLIENCRAEGIWSGIISVTDQIDKFIINDCDFNFSDNGRGFFNVLHHSGNTKKIEFDVNGLKAHVTSIYDCLLFSFGAEVSISKVSLKNSFIVKDKDTVFPRNYIAFCGITSNTESPEVVIDGCTLIAPRFNIDLFACPGDLIILNSIIKTWNEIAGQSGQVYITRNIASEPSPCANIVIRNNVFYGISFYIKNIYAKVSISNNRFGASVAGGNNCIYIDGDSNNDNAVSNLLIVNNCTQESSKKIKNATGVLDSSVVVEDNYNITKEGFPI